MASPDPSLAILVAAGLLTDEEAAAAPVGFPVRVGADPYALTEAMSSLSPAALRWRWEPERADDFCGWTADVLSVRFGVPLQMSYEPEDAPTLLRLRLDGREEVVDWAYLNSARWMGSFCTIAGRLLAAHGMEALELETGDFDAVVLFCRSEVSEELREMLPVAE